MGVFAAWWANPVSATLVMLATFGVLVLARAVASAIVRLGPIQLGGLLSQRPELLPGYPRRGDSHAVLVLFFTAVMGLALIVFSVVTLRWGQLIEVGWSGGLAVLIGGWALAIALSAAIIRGRRVEPVAVGGLMFARPATPILRWLAHGDAAEDSESSDDGEEVDDHELQAFIGAGEEAGILEAEDAELVASIVDLSDTVAREIMTPRTDVVALPVEAGFTEVEARFGQSMYTRIPVFRESLDRIEGVVHVKDVLRAAIADKAPTAGELMRSVLLVPETKPLRELLREFQSSRQQLAVVVDEYGGTSGIVTLEDVLEEIVGEIQDEHQRETPEVAQESEGVFLLSGGAHVDVLEELFGVEVGEMEVDSVAGVVLDRLGHLPRVGERTTWQGLELEVVEVDHRRLRRVRVHRAVEVPQ